MAKAAVSVPAAGATAAKIAVLTASDRAAGGVYEDKSGPAVVEMLKLFSDPWSYPLVMTNIAIENGHRNSGFSHEKW